MPDQRARRAPESRCLRQERAAEDGRSFADGRGGALGSISYWWVRQEARPYALPPDKTDSPLPTGRTTRPRRCTVGTRAAATATTS
ncbi:hypothetical protein ACWD9K_21800 [Streptomyces sp. 900116325]